MGMNKKITNIVFPAIALVIVALLIGFGLNNKTETEKPIGGDKDDHGCLVGAGYSWNDSRQQCVRSWEVPMMEEAESAVKSQLAIKYNKPLADVSAKVTKIDDSHMAGTVKFSSAAGAEGGQFLVYRDRDAWKIVYDGNGSVDCAKMKQLGFSALVLSPNFCD